MNGQAASITELSARIEQWLMGLDLGISRLCEVRRADGGKSSETWLITAEGNDGNRLDWVLRVQARVRQVYEDPSVARQFQLIRALSTCSSLPIPAAVALEEDTSILGAPFFLMERAEGKAAPDGYHSEGLFTQINPAAREAMWVEGIQMLARLNCVDPAPLAFLGWPNGPTDDGVAQELARWDSYLRWTRVPHLPIYEKALRWLDDHRPAPNGIGLAWGDARPCNILYFDGRASALLDWETASLGTAETDLGWWIFYDRMMSDAIGVPRLDGLPDAHTTIAIWEAESGRKAQAMEWHIAFAGYRFAMISEHAIRMGIRDGLMPSGMEGDGNPAVRLLAELVSK
ncbi:phosphotransferase family protein [Novosphingobium taihuense]|uniref:Aminoglycoside phosphotransferase (APT) family kinase protein n=1 Tax=Novosphingobium taihuense TaxID=260085 RepID=A0A7W7ADR7_9SPHN|nr:phosphotransferase family protein [Novosphingobium taihuense]MBB4615026.1 aminoglycoside phosphotransferase (APT) family kinase protein [Novosphingobium taihuense]TWH84532.1 aminoglycoside phosphotransferase (APT) family kinase protein [Novosphingobium taihuense]